MTNIENDKVWKGEVSATLKHIKEKVGSVDLKLDHHIDRCIETCSGTSSILAKHKSEIESVTAGLSRIYKLFIAVLLIVIGGAVTAYFK